MSELTCDNICKDVRFIGYHDGIDSTCPVPRQFDMPELVSMLKHCGNFCCPTVAKVVGGAGGGLCVRVNSVNGVVVVQNRNRQVIAGSGEVEGPVLTGDKDVLVLTVTNPFHEPSLVEIDVNCKLMCSAQTELTALYLVSDQKSEDVPVYFNAGNHATYGTGVESPYLDFHTRSQLSQIYLNGSGIGHLTLFMDTDILNNSYSSIGGSTMKLREILQPGETKTYYGQSWCKCRCLTSDASVYYHTGMVADVNIFRGVI